MEYVKKGTTRNSQPMHYSVGAVIYQKSTYLLINRAVSPLGYAGIAGHIDENEEPVDALKREVMEESGLTVTKATLLLEEEVDGNWCSKGVHNHYWYIYDCKVSGDLHPSKRETKSIGWYTQSEIQKLNLEPVWHYWFEQLKILP